MHRACDGGDWFGLLTQAAVPRGCFEAAGAHAFDAGVSVENHANTPYPTLEFCTRNVFRGLTKTCMSRNMVSEGFTPGSGGSRS